MPIDPKDVEAETAAFTAQAVAETAKDLPLGERKNLIDQLLATNLGEVKAA